MRAMIFGVTGQDGSYLAELLLEKGHTVIGIARRTSCPSHSNIQEALQHKNFILAEGDVCDPMSLDILFRKYEPEQVYNLAAQSHVGTSFSQPKLTWDVNAVGVMNIVDTLFPALPSARLYQASTSEMFGDNYSSQTSDFVDNRYIVTKYQDENTPFRPRSPYAIAKLAAHHTVVMHREAYDRFACAGVLMNHETMYETMPIIYRIDDSIDIKPIGELVCDLIPFNKELNKYQQGEVSKNVEVWDFNGWTKVKYASGYPHAMDKNPRFINARNSVYLATGNHICIMEDMSEKTTSDIQTGDKVNNTKYPEIVGSNSMTLEEAELIGMICGDGHIDDNNNIRITNTNKDILKHIIHLWNTVTYGRGTHYIYDGKSGFSDNVVQYIGLHGNCESSVLLKSDNLKNEIYDITKNTFGHRTKRIPKIILNSNADIMEAFLNGYNLCDGLKANRCKYKFKNFKTNSATLAAGLLFLIENVTGQRFNITVEESYQWGKQQFYYSINLLSNSNVAINAYNKIKDQLHFSTRAINRNTGVSRSFIRKVKQGYIPSLTNNLTLPSNEVKKIIELPKLEGWMFDLETESGTFSCGVGLVHVHNSPRRGLNFVTRKITNYVAKLSNHLESGSTIDFPKLRLGNLEAKRDWGYAPDYVIAMYMMLNRDVPDDFIIATGQTRSVRDFLTCAFAKVGIYDWSPYVTIDEQLIRPAEVPHLLGVATKANRVLGWTPTTSFDTMVENMIKHDILQ